MERQPNDHVVVFSLCSGIGAFEVALSSLPHIRNPKIYFSEISNNAIGVYQAQFPHSISLGDLKDIKNSQIEDAITGTDRQFVFAGFPCQNISMANNVTRQGLEGPKSSLFYEVIRVINVIKNSKRPNKLDIRVILENVRGAKETMETITTTLQTTLPNDKVYMNVMDSSICSTQSRQRVFWTNFEVKKLEPICGKPPSPLIDVLEPYETVIGRYNEIKVSEKFVNMYNKIMNEKNAEKTILAELVPLKKGANIQLWKTNIVHNQPRSRWQKYPFSDSAHPRSKTITLNHPNHHIIDRRASRNGETFVVRQFLAEELERLFDFPVGWTRYSAEGHELSNKERTILLGNSIVVSVIRHIFLNSKF